MPYLESVTIGDDVWDENWLPLQAKMGKGDDAGFGMPTASPGGDECPPCEEIPQEVRAALTEVGSLSCNCLGLKKAMGKFHRIYQALVKKNTWVFKIVSVGKGREGRGETSLWASCTYRHSLFLHLPRPLDL